MPQAYTHWWPVNACVNQLGTGLIQKVITDRALWWTGDQSRLYPMTDGIGSMTLTRDTELD